MTYKEFTECARPELVDEFEVYYTGGVFGCPTRTRFKDGELLFTRDCKTVDDLLCDCAECWNQEMDANETARAIEVYGSEWYLSALAYIGEKKHDSAV